MDFWDDHPVIRLLGGGLVLIVALFMASLLAWQLVQDLAIWVLGREVKADVVDLWVEQVGDQDEGELEFRYYLQYRFATPSGETITKTTTVSVNEWAGGSEEGGQIAVVYFPPYPEHNRLDDARYVPLSACAYVPAILIAMAVLMAGWQLFYPPIRLAVGGKRDERRREDEGKV